MIAVAANDFDPADVAADLRKFSRLLSPIAFTSHGGGANVLRLGNLHAPEAVATDPQSAVHDLDEERSPYFLLPELIALGVRFFNPVGRTAGPDLVPIDGLTQPARLKNGDPAIFFTRYLSMRHEALGLPTAWCYGKSLPHAAALGFQISDTLERLHWLPAGHGGILYTHFGHNVGNQVRERLAWTEETHAAFERVARYYHPDHADGTAAFRLWVAPTSSVLLYSWVAQRAARFISVVNSEVRVASWRDDALRTQVPDLARHGTRLLHGITVYVDSAAQAEAVIDGRPVQSFTRNPADESGRESITFVDDSNPQALLLEETELQTSDPGGIVDIPIAPLSLAGVTHWSFELDCAGDDVEVGFRDSHGAIYFAGRSPGANAVWMLGTPRKTGWCRYTYALAARRPHPAGPPKGKIVGITARIGPKAATLRPRLRRTVLLRPNASVTTETKAGSHP